MIILFEKKNVKGFFKEMCEKRLEYVVKITEQNKCPLVKDFGHF